MTVHQQVGHLIDFYNIQFYNQGIIPMILMIGCLLSLLDRLRIPR